MNTLGNQLTSSTTKKSPQGNNSFANALLEQEKNLSSAPQPGSNINPFSEALARTGGRTVSDDEFSGDNQFDQDEQLRLQQEQIEKQKKDALRAKLHREINPVETVDIFSQREKRVKEELEKTREELKLLAKDIAKLRNDLDIETMKQVVTPGLEGKYYVSFFQKLRAFIMLLRQQIKSASTWTSQMHKKKKKKGPGSAFVQQSTKAVHDMMHHERSTAFSGG